MATGVVGSERPGLKPRAQSASPLKGAVRRTGARVDRLGAGAVWISRLQPAWGLSPAVHGWAIVETGARLIGDACRARRVGHDRLPRRPARRARQRLAPTRWATHPRSGIRVRRVGRSRPSCRGQAVPNPPARQGWQTTTGVRRRSIVIIDGCRDATRMCRAMRRGGRGAAWPLQRGAVHPRLGGGASRGGATTPALSGPSGA